MEPARGMEGLDSEEGDTALHAESTQSNGIKGEHTESQKNEQNPDEA